MVFEGPHLIQEFSALGGHDAAFAGGGEDLVLAEAPGGHIAEAAHGLAWMREPWAWAQTSITSMPWARASSRTASMSTDQTSRHCQAAQ